MPFQVISPIFMDVDGKDFNEALKNFVKLNHHLNLTQLIITDQTRNMHANIEYIKEQNRKTKSKITWVPTTMSVIPSGAVIPPFGVSVSGVDPRPYGPINDFGRPIVALNNRIDGPPVNVIGPSAVGIAGPAVVGPAVVGGLVGGPMGFGIANRGEWFDNTTKTKHKDSDNVEKLFRTAVGSLRSSSETTIKDDNNLLGSGIINVTFNKDANKTPTEYTCKFGTTTLTRQGASPSGGIIIGGPIGGVGRLPLF